MSDAGDAVREYQRNLSKRRSDLETEWRESIETMRKYRFAWTEGYHTLYKFKSFTGESRNHVFDMITNSRIYLSNPNEFNDPLDCAPVLRWAKSPSDPEFLKEIQADEDRLMRESGDSLEEIAHKRVTNSVPVEDVPHAATVATRKQLRDDSKIFCLTARQDHPLQWSHYADSHRGICLHFQSARGTLFGLARAVQYAKKRQAILMPLRYNRSHSDVVEVMAWMKADFWSYEHEYRIVCRNEDDLGFKLNGSFCSFDRRLLTGITMGMNIGDTDRKLIKQWAGMHAPELQVFQAGENMDRFRVEVWRVA